MGWMSVPSCATCTPSLASRSSLAPRLWRQHMSQLGRSLFHLVWLCKSLPSAAAAAAHLQPPRQTQTPSSSSELASWETTPSGGKSLLASVLQDKTSGLPECLLGTPGCGNPRGMLGCRAKHVLVLAVLVVKPFTS